MSSQTLERLLEKRAQTQHLIQQLGIDAWIIYVADNKAESLHLPLIGAREGAVERAYIITPSKAIAICPTLEADIQREYLFEVIELPDRNIIDPLARTLAEIFPKGIATKIALNFSDRFANIDTIGHGTYQRITQALASKSSKFQFLSADGLIMQAASTKLPYEIDLMRRAAQVTHEVLTQIFSQIRSGMTELQVAQLAHDIVERRIAQDPHIGYSWPKAENPIVLAGEGIAGSPHAAPSQRIIKPGSTVYIDFGLSIDGYCGDLQHLGYVLRPDETQAPDHIRKMYDLLVTSIKAGMQAAIPRVAGWVVDAAARKVITEAGYPSYKHGTGHQLGAGSAHTPGVAFTLQDNPLSQLLIQEGYTMTIEPRIQIKNGASIEVDGVITPHGFELLCPTQPEIHLIR